jgi:predicted MFS family arabinose efflux permease
MMIFCTFAMNTTVIIPVFADTVLELGVNGYTDLLSTTGIGAFVGAIYMANRAGKVSNKQIVLDTIFISILHIIAAFVKAFPVSMALMFMLGFFSITFLNMSNAIIQMNTSDAYRGRVMSVYTLANQGSHPLGNAFAGAVMEYFGAAMGFVGCGAMALILLCSVPGTTRILLTSPKNYSRPD